MDDRDIQYTSKFVSDIEKREEDTLIIKGDVGKLKRALFADDMAYFIWEFKHNYWRKYKHDESDFCLDQFKDDLNEMLNDCNINIDGLHG